MARQRKKIDFNAPHRQGDKFPPVMYGLRGLCEIFEVSKATASRYAKTFLREAVTQNGNVLIIDTECALRCFGVKNPRSFIRK